MADLRSLLEMRQAVPLSFSHDGTRLLVASNIPGTHQLYVLPARGGELEQLTDHAEPVSGLFLPDGRVLVEIDAGGNERTQLHVLDAGKLDPYGAAWAWAGNTPFQWGKQVASHLGGNRNPMVVHWPERITDRGALRSQFTHVIDVAPTILEVAGIPAPATVDGIDQEPLQGIAFTTRSPTAMRRSTARSSTSRRSATGPCTRTAGGSR